MHFKNTFILRFAFIVAFCCFATIKSTARDLSHSGESGIKSVMQQSIKISGTVADDKGETIPGAVVSVKGSSLATASALNGEFSIIVPDENAVIQFKMMGYKPQEILVGQRRVLSVIMIEEEQSLNEVTVVAFGKQKKESVISSITTINPSELKVPSSNLTTAFAGSVAGVIAYQRSGEPGQDNADFFVRGITTFGTNANPLILIDNVELTSTDLARLQPDEIQSFSVMKDATATALYGARGANGVILVTTKTGAVGPAKVSFRLENSFSAPTTNVELADPVTYMKLNNEAVLTREKELTPTPYSQEKIDNTVVGSNSLIYPANDWMKMLMKDYTMNQRANLSVSGGGGVAKYYVAAAYSKDNGMLNVDKRNNFNNNIQIDIYNLRANVNIDITKTTEMVVRLNGNFEDYSGPIKGGTETYNMIMHSNPVYFPAYYPADEANLATQHILFGNATSAFFTNPYAEMVKGYKDRTRSQILAQLELKQDLKGILKGLTARAMLNLARLSEFSAIRSYSPFYYGLGSYDSQTGAYVLSQLNKDGTEYLAYEEGAKVMTSSNYFEGALNYQNEFAGKHGLSGLLVFQATENKDGVANNFLELSLPSRNLGMSGRATYSYDHRYFAEFNFGYNGSERFYIDHRFGFFPSVGGAWVISNEEFLAPYKDIFTNLKLRYSYGLVGNDNIGSKDDRFYYLSRVSLDSNARGTTFGQNLNITSNGVQVNRYANFDITWERSKKQNVALELGLWGDLDIIAEYFTEYRDHILMERADIPSTMGLAALMKANVGEASAKGTDISLEYQHSWNKDFWSSARGNFTYSSGKYEVYEEPAYKQPWRYKVGNSLRQNYGYVAERLFVSDEEAQNSPAQKIGASEYGGGDIKYLDIDNNGVIDENDIVPIGNPTVPEIVYGFGVSMGYKTVDFSLFFQGATNESFWIDAVKTSPFNNDTQLLKSYADSYWSEETQNIYATWPRLTTTINTNNTATNTWFMRDGSFLRLKQMELGYTLPAKFQKKLGTSNLRFYMSGTNLLLFSKFKLWDVEMGGNGLGYPIQRVFNLGVNVSFN